MSNSIAIRSSFVLALLFAGCSAVALAQTPVNRIVRPIDENQVVTLSGNVHPMARPEFDRGMVSAETLLQRMVLQLTPSAEQQAELDALVEAQHNPQSPLYHQWLTPAQYGARFGASAADLAQIAGWLKAHGFVVEEIPANNRQVIFSGTAGQVADTFHTEIHHYLVNGVNHIANVQDPQIPAALAGVVGGVVSLHDFRRNSAIRSRTALGAQSTSQALPQYSSGSTHYLSPADWATIYDLNSLYSAGTTGSGTSIAIVGRSNINMSDVTGFRSFFGLKANNPTVTLVSTNPGLVSGDQDESTLDVEWSGAVAPSATVKFVVGASTSTTDGVDLSAQYIVNHLTAPIVSTSYGSCEMDMGSAELGFYNSLWQQAASQGMSAFVSSGDSGAAGCYGGSSTSASGTGVNGLCSSPYSTCVGGTEFNEGSNPSQYWSATNSSSYESALSYIPEEVWNESGSNGGSGLWASGGGISTYYTQPTWQKGVTGTSAANGMRAVPDVAMTAASHDGYLIEEDGSYWVIAGTSAASPSFAGVMALVVQARSASQGNANAGLYPLLNASVNPFHATPSGSNSVPGVTGFTASGAAYNLATGLGSVDGAKLVSSWGKGSSTTTVDFTLKASASSGTVLVGKSTTLTISATESGSAKNAIALTATAPAGVTVTFSPTSITSNTTSTMTIAVGLTASAGAQSITITGTDATGKQTATYALTVTLPPTLTLSAAASSLSLQRGGSGAVGLTASTGGSYSGSISYTVSGLPAGVTAAWSSNPTASTSGTSSIAETLTLTASSSATVGSATVTVTAAGDGLTASKQFTLQVTAPPPTLTITPTATSVSAVQGNSVTDVVNLAGNSSYSGAVTLSVSGLPSGVTASWSKSPVTLTAESGSSTLTLTASSSAAAASSTITVTANGDGMTATKQITLQVTAPPPTLTVTPTATSVSAVRGNSVTDVVNLAGNSSYSGAVTLSVSGLPSGVTASWTKSPVTLTAESGSSTLTLTASSSAAVASSTVTVTATGDGLTALCANMSETSSPSTITVGRGKKSHFDEHNQDQHFLRCVGSFGA